MSYNWFIYLFVVVCPVIIYLFKNNIKLSKKRSKTSAEVILFGLPWCRQTELQKKLLSVEHLNAIKIKDMRDSLLQFEESPSWLCGGKILPGIKTNRQVTRMINRRN